MGYVRAEQILPVEIIEIIQKYVDGEYIYIPKKHGTRLEWGKNTQIKQELKERNDLIYHDFMKGQSVAWLAKQYYLSEKSIQRIVCSRKKENNLMSRRI